MFAIFDFGHRIKQRYMQPTTRVRDTELFTTDTRQQYREKIARITLDAMVQFVGLLDTTGIILEINHVALEAGGLRLSDVEGKPIWDTFWWQVPEEAKQTLREMISRAAKGECVRWNTPVYAGGEKGTIIVDASFGPVRDDQGNVVFICAEGRDITEQVAQAQEIAQKNEELQSLLERIRELDELRTPLTQEPAGRFKLSQEAEQAKRQAMEGMNRELQLRTEQLSSLFAQTPSFMAVLRGPDHVFELANASFLKLVGHRDVVGKTLPAALPEIKDQGIIEMLDYVFATGKPLNGSGVLVMLQREPGAALEERYLNFIYQPLLGPDKVVSGIFVEGHDVTEEVLGKKQLLDNEKRLREQALLLEKQVQERTRSLQELNQSLKSSNDDLQQFAHVASHDLKEPVRKIKTFGMRLQQDYQHLLPEKGIDYLHKLLHAADRMYAMIDGVLSYSTMVNEEQDEDIVDLNKVFRNIETDLEVLMQEKKARLIIEQPLPQVEGVPVLLYQLFYNLVNNALKFSRAGEPPEICVEYSIVALEGNQLAKIVVSDNGIGFDQKDAEKIFTTFTRLHSKDQYEGTGLGLALCKKIVQHHGGLISASGEKNKGAAFTVLLPVFN